MAISGIGQSTTTYKAPAKKTATVEFEYDARGLTDVHDPVMKGSFNANGTYDANWSAEPIKMSPKKDAPGVYTAKVELDWDPNAKYTWYVEGKRNGKHQPLILSDDNPSFQIWKNDQKVTYAPVSNHLYGVHKNENGAADFRTWAPNSQNLSLDLYGKDGKLAQSIPMEKDPVRGDFTTSLPSFKNLEGLSYRYSERDENGNIAKTESGKEISYADPVSRFLQGQQRGVERIYVEPILGFETGWYDDSGSGGPNYKDNPQWGRFSVNGHQNADNVQLVLRDAEGKQLTKAQLLERLGEPKFQDYDTAPAKDKHDVDVLRGWTMGKTKPITDYVWADRVNDDGSINLKKVENKTNGANWIVAVNNFPELVGLDYEFQVTENGKLVGDTNGDKILQPEERKATPFNDPYDSKISARPGSGRNTLIKESSFVPQYQDAPRMETDPMRYSIYEVHPGSFMGSKDNTLPGTFETFINNLEYIKSLNVNTIELLPTSECGGKREWGYTPDHFFAGADAYAFEMKRDDAVAHGLIRPDENIGQESVYINGTDATRFAVDQAHKKGFNVIGDVVYNHTSGRPDGDNPLWDVDGDKRTYFKWNGTHESNTPWGAKPNFGAAGVKDFVTNHSVEQIKAMGYDGIRYDFAQVLHNTGDAGEQIEGMKALRQINRTLQAVQPGTYTVAEDFTRNWLVAADLDRGQNQWGVEKKGMGFGGVWTDRFRLDTFGVAEHNKQFNMDSLMEALTCHVGVTDFSRAVVYAHSHDEVGNSGKWMGRAAAGSKEDDAVFQRQPRNVARAIAALNILGAGVPMIWQGEEFNANNDFKHGLTATWGHDTDWLEYPINPAEYQQFRQIEAQGQQPSKEQADKYKVYQSTDRDHGARMADRQGQKASYADAFALKASSHAFDANAAVQRLSTNNADETMAILRKSGNDEFVVASNFSDQDRGNYGINLPQGTWQEVYNSAAAVYGGSNVGNVGAHIPGGAGVMLPAGSTVCFKRV